MPWVSLARITWHLVFLLKIGPYCFTPCPPDHARLQSNNSAGAAEVSGQEVPWVGLGGLTHAMARFGAMPVAHTPTRGVIGEVYL